MISLNITGKLNLPSAFLDSSLNIKTDDERLYIYIYIYTGYTQKNGAVSKVNKKFISHLTFYNGAVLSSDFNIYMAHMNSRWCTSDLHLSPLIFKHLSHCDIKACSPTWKKNPLSRPLGRRCGLLHVHVTSEPGVF
jgi:hypothetical protein